MKFNYIILEGTENRNKFFLIEETISASFFLYLRKGDTKKLIQPHNLYLKLCVCFESVSK